MDNEVQAAMGFFVPVITIINLIWVLIMGVQILCAQYRGRGESQKLRALFDIFIRDNRAGAVPAAAVVSELQRRR